MGPVQQAIRSAFSHAPVTLHTLSQRKPFTLSVIDGDGIVLLLGQGQTYVRLEWDCLESVATFLRGQTGWVPAGGAHSVSGEPGTLDEYLKRWTTTDVARWLVRVLRDAGVVEVVGGPLRVRLRHPTAR